jgi:hypothetical protein
VDILLIRLMTLASGRMEGYGSIGRGDTLLSAISAMRLAHFSFRITNHCLLGRRTAAKSDSYPSQRREINTNAEKQDIMALA